MATKTVGTVLTTSLVAIQWQPAGLNKTDLATINEAIYNVTDPLKLKNSARIENGWLYLPGRNPREQGIPLAAGDWICVDTSTGWVIVIPNAVMAVSTAFTHN